MADLDDFFAKKDRKKAKNIKKYSTADELAKKLEDTGKKTEKPKQKDRSNQEQDETRQEIHVSQTLNNIFAFSDSNLSFYSTALFKDMTFDVVVN